MTEGRRFEIENAKQRLAAATCQASLAAKAQQTAEKMKQYASSNLNTTRRNCEGAQKQFDCMQNEVDGIQREMNELERRLAKAKSQSVSASAALETAKSMARNATNMLENAVRNVDAANSQIQSSQKEVDEAEQSLREAEKKLDVGKVGVDDEDSEQDEASFTLETAKAISQYASTMLRTVTQDADEATSQKNSQQYEVKRDKYCVKGPDEQWAAVKVKVDTDDESEVTEANSSHVNNKQSKKRRKVSFGTNMTKVFGHDDSSISVAGSDASSTNSTFASSKSSEMRRKLLSTRTSNSNNSVGECDASICDSITIGTDASELCHSESSFTRQLASELCHSEHSSTQQVSTADSSHCNTITVEGAGVKECNGVYARIPKRTYGGAPVYLGCKGYWRGKSMQFVLFCSNAVWYIGAAEPNVCPPALILYRTSRSYFNISSPPPKTGWSIAYEGKFPSPRLCFEDTSVSSTSNASIIHAPSPQRDSSNNNVGTPKATQCTSEEKIIVIDGAAIPGVNGTYNPKPNSTMYCKPGIWDGVAMEFVLFRNENGLWNIGVRRVSSEFPLKTILYVSPPSLTHGFGESDLPPIDGWFVGGDGKGSAPKLRIIEKCRQANYKSNATQLANVRASQSINITSASTSMSIRHQSYNAPDSGNEQSVIIDNRNNKVNGVISTIRKKTFPPINVDMCGIEEANGTYFVAEINQDGSPMYEKKGEWKGKAGSFWIVREWTVHRKHWVLSHSPCDSPSSFDMYMVLCDMFVSREENMMPQKTCWVPHHHGVYPAPRLKW